MTKVEEIKLITLGNTSVGKTSFITKYVDNKFCFDYKTTLGIDFKRKKIKLKNGKDAFLRIFDTAGQERFKSVSFHFIKKVDGIILIYDIGNLISFKEIDNWIESIEENGKENLCIILVGNKCDLSGDKREVSFKQGQKKSNELGIPFFETSCKDGINIKEVFEKLIEDILNKGDKNKAEEIKIFNKSKNEKKYC